MNKPRADFTNTIIDGVLILTDLDLGHTSLTNDIENVIQFIINQEVPGTIDLHKIIYRDSDGMYGGFDFEFKTFIPIQTTSMKEAIDYIKSYAVKVFFARSKPKYHANLKFK